MSHIVEACCTRPPVLGEDYEPAGKKMTISGLETYYVGPSTSSKAVLFLYDALGWTHQTYTAADLLSSLMPDTIVFMPDFFQGKAVPQAWFALPKEELGKKVGEWIGTVGSMDANLPVAERFVSEAPGAGFSNIQKWGAFGLCWGGKMTARSSCKGTRYAVAGTGHPGRPEAKEAEAMVIPYICLLSPEDGPLEDRQAYEKALNENDQDTYVETYDRIHGWMGARADFKNATDKAEFERGYKKVAEFMNKHLA